MLLKVTRGCNGILVSANLRISNLGYADYLPYMAESDSFDSYGKVIKFNISIKKTKAVASFPVNIILYGETIKQKGKFV